ncbi:M24 family metallopeptidase [Natronosalvus halobius]|uniref:M24 family metallopeptidase n=1 Tax=Natronosalvus halobius TaxID=2953746 RepID=UPI00209D4DCC|nr:Xaa-Pro peptidase family protein [Natronosalvus halobius]USZ73341.1 Xaa-Pro peptidase family protein [Natronosalvus halobius]
MEIDLSPLTDFLAAEELDGYLIDDDATDSDQRYVSGFSAPDAYQTLVTPDGAVHLLVSGLEYGRAVKESGADTVTRYATYDSQELIAEHGRYEGFLRVQERFLDDREIASVGVPRSFPTGTADGLRARGLEVTVEPDGIVGEIRSVKHDEEIEHVHRTQRANQSAMAVAESLIGGANVEDDVLYHEGEPLTSERVTEEIEVALLRNGCSLDETIVACGEHGADPHDRGSGPLEANELIVIDIFPRDKETKYFGDMTRTFCRGDPTDEMRRRYEVTREAFEAALEAIEPGVTGAAVHDAVCDVIEDAGYATFRSDPGTETGFIHSTGHGVGLDIHESPSLSPSGEELEVGHVVTVEPGIYDPAVGGVRIEDLVVVTEDGYENLTDYPIDLEPSIRTEPAE